jgi:hypothetical protein
VSRRSRPWRVRATTGTTSQPIARDTAAGSGALSPASSTIVIAITHGSPSSWHCTARYSDRGNCVASAHTTTARGRGWPPSPIRQSSAICSSAERASTL